MEHEKTKFVSTSGHVIFCFKQQYIGDFSNLPKISDHFRKFSEGYLKLIRTFPIIFRNVPKMSEDFRRLPKVAEYFRTVSII